jgi:uncharacterized protein YjeT (DUF2065 family)
MLWSDLLAAFALYLVLDSVLPFLNPQFAKRLMVSYASMTDSQMRVCGLIGMAAGLALLHFVRS